MEVDVAILQATVETNYGTLFPAGTAGVGACRSEEVLGPDCESAHPARRRRERNSRTGPPARYLELLRLFPSRRGTHPGSTWSRTLATGDLVDPPLSFGIGLNQNPNPPLSVSPDTGLTDGPQGQAVVVDGSDFAPNEPVSVSQCANVPPIGGYVPCDDVGAAHPDADENGAFSVPLTVHSLMTSNGTTPEAQYDCIAVGCVVVASQNGVSAEHSVSFFRTPGTLSGTVRDTNGDPVPGVSVGACVAPGSPGPSCLQGFASTNASGNYTLQVQGGTYNVAAIFGGGATAVRSPDASVTIVTGRTTTQDFTLPLGKVSGSVVDGNGQPFPSSGVATCPAPSVPSAPTFCPGLQTRRG